MENLLLDNEGKLKISDFGHAGIFSAGKEIREFSGFLFLFFIFQKKKRMGLLFYFNGWHLVTHFPRTTERKNLQWRKSRFMGSGSVTVTFFFFFRFFGVYSISSYRLLTGKIPFWGSDIKQFIQVVNEAKVTFPENISSGKNHNIGTQTKS